MDNNINKFVINFQGKQYILTTEIYQNNIRITCIQPNNSNSLDYTFDASLETLRQLSTAFHSTLTIKDAKDLIDKMIEEEKIQIQNIGNQINVILYLVHQNENAILPLNPSLTNMANTAYIQQNIPTEPIVLPPIYSQDPLQQTANMNIPIQEGDAYGLSNLQETLSVVRKIPNNIPQNPQNYYYPIIHTQTSGNQNYFPDNMNYVTNMTDNNEIKGDHEKIKSDINNLSNQLNQLTKQVNLINQNLNNLNPNPNQNIYKIPSPNDMKGNFILQQENEKPSTERTNYNNINNNGYNNYNQNNNNISDLNQSKNMYYQNNDNYNQNNNNNKNKNTYNQNNDNRNENIDNYNQNNNFNQNNSTYNQNNDNFNENNDNYFQNNNIYGQNNNNRENELSHIKTKIQELENERDKTLRENDNLKSQIQNLLKSQKINKNGDSLTVKGNLFRNNEEYELIVRKLGVNYGKIYIDLIYKASVDSDKAAAFHQKCDNAESSIVLVESGNGKRFGGFTSCDWKGDSIMKKDDEAFIFSLDKMEIYDVIPGEDAIGCFPNYGPVFAGCQIKIKDEAFSNGGTTFERGINYNTNEDYELTGGDKEFVVKEIEVYSIKFK